MKTAPGAEAHRASCIAPALGLALAMSPALVAFAGAQAPFVHPGILHRTADLERMRDEVAAGQEPYVTGWERLRTDPRAALDYSPDPHTYVQRIPDTFTYEALINDAIAAHTQAIAWAITGNETYAINSMRVLNAWSSTLTSFPPTGDPILASSITGYQLAAAGEVLRATYPSWPVEDQERLEALLLQVFYPPNHNFLLYHEPDGQVHTSTGVNQHFYASWDAGSIATIIAIAVFADDRERYDEAVEYFKSGTGNANIMRAVFDGATGQLQESGRDPEHAQLGIGLLATFCEIAWNQGDDLYGYADNRLLAGFEYTASYLLGNSVPFTTYSDPFRTHTAISSESSASQIAQAMNAPRPIFEMVWNHYENRRGVPAPFTRQLANAHRPEGFRADHIGFGTILFTRDYDPADATGVPGEGPDAGTTGPMNGGVGADAGATTDGAVTTSGVNTGGAGAGTASPGGTNAASTPGNAIGDTGASAANDGREQTLSACSCRTGSADPTGHAFSLLVVFAAAFMRRTLAPPRAKCERCCSPNRR